MTTLTPEQQRLVEKAGDEPVKIEDPESHRVYLVIKEEVYARLRKTSESGPSVPSPTVSALVRQSRDAFLYALPGLLEDRPKQWACFHGKELIGTDREKTPLVRECVRRGLDGYYVGMIVPHPPGDEIDEVEDSFVERDADL